MINACPFSSPITYALTMRSFDLSRKCPFIRFKKIVEPIQYYKEYVSMSNGFTQEKRWGSHTKGHLHRPPRR